MSRRSRSPDREEKPRNRQPVVKEYIIKVYNYKNIDIPSLEKELLKFGPIIESRPYQDTYLFEFRDSRDAFDARYAFDGKMFQGNRLEIIFHHWEVWIGNLDLDITEKDILDCFREFGCVQVRLVSKSRGTVKGYGFLHFRTERDSLDALKEMNGFMIGGCPILVKPVTKNPPKKEEKRDEKRDERPTYAPNEDKKYSLMQKLHRSHQENPTRCIVLKNMVTPDQVDKLLEEEILYECNKHGKVTGLVIYQEPVKDDVEVKIYVLFDKAEEATLAQSKLDNRYFDGKTVHAEFYPEEDFINRKYETK